MAGEREGMEVGRMVTVRLKREVELRERVTGVESQIAAFGGLLERNQNQHHQAPILDVQGVMPRPLAGRCRTLAAEAGRREGRKAQRHTSSIVDLVAEAGPGNFWNSNA